MSVNSNMYLFCGKVFFSKETSVQFFPIFNELRKVFSPSPLTIIIPLTRLESNIIY